MLEKLAKRLKNITLSAVVVFQHLEPSTPFLLVTQTLRKRETRVKIQLYSLFGKRKCGIAVYV
jgi:hypothetical protein